MDIHVTCGYQEAGIAPVSHATIGHGLLEQNNIVLHRLLHPFRIQKVRSCRFTKKIVRRVTTILRPFQGRRALHGTASGIKRIGLRSAKRAAKYFDREGLSG